MEVEGWKPFRKALPRDERKAFDEMLNGARLYASASSSAVRTSRFEGLMMAVLFHHFKTLRGCAEAMGGLEGSPQGGVDE